MRWFDTVSNVNEFLRFSSFIRDFGERSTLKVKFAINADSNTVCNA
jgi:hypothetical protein